MNNSNEEMSFLEHLEELRWHLLRSCMAILVFGTIAFLAKDFIFNTILFGPKQIDFVTYQFFCDISKAIGTGDAFCINEMPFRIQSRTMSGQFSAHLWTSITAGFIVGFPYILYEFWRFVSPGLLKNERKNARGFIFIASIRQLSAVLKSFISMHKFARLNQASKKFGNILHASL